MRKLLVKPWNMIGSDGGYTLENFALDSHPRFTGTFSRILGRYVRELRLLTLEEVVRKMTVLPASFLNLKSRGRIAVGFGADVDVFDPKTIADRSDYDHPNLYSTGVTNVLVNGIPVLLDGKMTGDAPGKFLARETSAAASGAGQ